MKACFRNAAPPAQNILGMPKGMPKFREYVFPPALRTGMPR
jgi:hypothetical protein